MPLQTHTLIEFVYLDSFKIMEIRMIQLTERRYHGTMLVTQKCRLLKCQQILTTFASSIDYGATSEVFHWWTKKEIS